uniref:Uncharacterized protein LOC108041270 isoform X2 n=1 Tax=Drosophila rhopaloa TaxID=1041015 RepID=A0A6P4E9B5_DRORH
MMSFQTTTQIQWKQIPTLKDALKDHNYTSQKEILCQPNPDFIREILLNVIIPSTNIVKDIPTDIYNFIENTIKNLKLHQLQYAEKKENRLNIRETLLTNNDSQTRKTKRINQNYPEPLEIYPNDQYLNNIHLNLSNREVLTSLLENTMCFAKQLFFESKTFASKSERELRELIYEKIKKLKEILGRTNMNSKHLLNNRYQHNFKAKMNLILDTSESSQTDFELKSSCHEMKSESPNKSSTRICSKQLICGSSQNKSHDQNFSDDIDLSKYIKLEITFNPIAGVFKELDTKIKPCKSDNDTDKEIER